VVLFRRFKNSFDTSDIGLNLNKILDLSFMQELFLQPLDVGECPLMVLIGLSFVGGMTFEMIRV
jgi:hypothetical protein